MRASGPFERVFVVALLAAFAALATTSMRGKNPTVHETAYLGAGVSLVQTGDSRLSPEHPALPIRLAGAAASAAGAKAPVDSDSWRDADPWGFGHEVLYGEGADWRRILFAGRLPMVALGVLLGAVLWLWARAMIGGAGAAVALVLYAFSPNFLAHTRLVTTDVPLTLTAVATAACLWAARRSGRIGWTIAAAVCVGLSVATQSTAFSFGPVWLLLALWPSEARPMRKSLGHAAVLLVGAVVFTVGIVSASHGFAFDGVTMRSLGPRAETGSWWSPFVALAVKLPIPFLLLTAIGAGLAIRTERGRRAELLFLAAPALLVLATNVVAGLDPGVRPLLPMFPFLMLLAAWPLRGAGFRGGLLSLVGLVVLLGSLAIGTLRAHPHFLPYFHVLAGGPAGGARLLGGSDLDWGQDLSLAAERLRERGVTGAILGYYGSADPFVEEMDWQILPPPPRARSRDRWTALPPEGELWVAMSLTNRRGIHPRGESGREGDPYPWLAGVEPAEVVGGSIQLLNLTHEHEAQVGLVAVYKRNGLVDEAEGLLNRIVERWKFDLESRRELTNLYQARGEWSAAELVMLGAPNPEPEDVRQVAELRKRLGNSRAVREAYEAGVRAFSTDHVTRNEYAWYLQEIGEDLDHARSLIDEALRWQPDDPSYLDTKGMILRRLERPEEAIEVFEAALGVPGGDRPAIRWHRSRALLEAGRTDEAIAEAEALRGREDLPLELAEEIEAWFWQIGG